MSRIKSKTAAQVIVEEIIEKSKFPTFWTLTTADIISGKELGLRWNWFLIELKRATEVRHRVFNPKTKRYRTRILQHSDIHGFRVIETHKDGIRLHIHLVLNQYVDAELMWSLAAKTGFGRIDVRPIDKSRPFTYLTKYLAKQQRKGSLRGVRLWSEFAGKGAKKTGIHANDVKIGSSFHVMWNDPEVQDEIAVTSEQARKPYAKYLYRYEKNNENLRKMFGDDYKLKKPKTFLQFRRFMELLNFKNLFWERYIRPQMKTEFRLLQRLRYDCYRAGYCSHLWLVDVDELDY